MKKNVPVNVEIGPLGSRELTRLDLSGRLRWIGNLDTRHLYYLCDVKWVNFYPYGKFKDTPIDLKSKIIGDP